MILTGIKHKFCINSVADASREKGAIHPWLITEFGIPFSLLFPIFQPKLAL
jgi:hypothetical protein